MTTEGYVLDGIRTAMVETNEVVGDYAVGTIVTCGCGWSRGTYMENTVDTRAALRFHYQNCEQARLRSRTGERARSCRYCGIRQSSVSASHECFDTPYVRGGHDFRTERERNTPSAALDTGEGA